ncbi:hypothetical protein [Tenacibaculum aiptasiae]|uniref:hypothetical protein n=1 Tax=Tenacibaculum aiptasiae TaxID=426481 RepID=UPI003B5C35B8
MKSFLTIVKLLIINPLSKIIKQNRRDYFPKDRRAGRNIPKEINSIEIDSFE